MFCHGQDTSKIQIYPLYPYSASPTDYDSTTERARNFIVKYYFIRGATKATDDLSQKVDSFLMVPVLKDSSNFNSYGSYLVYVFKESDKTNENYRNRGTDDTPDSHIDDDLMYIYEWRARKFYGCDFYKNGQVIKTIDKKLQLIFK